MHRQALTAALVVAFAAGSITCSRQTPTPRNLLIISVDTLRADRLGAYGYDRPTSPELDAFAETAVVFDEAQAHSSWTLASFASLMTSLYPSTHRCTGYNSKLDDAHLTLGEVLGAAGFRTAAVVSHVYLGRRFGLHQGFAEYDESLVFRIMKSHEAISSEKVTARGTAWLRARAAADDGDRWCLWLHYFDPHDTYQPHPGLSEQFGISHDTDLYDGEVAFTDRAIGEVLRTLEESGAADDTIVVFVSDHGEEFLDHGRKGHGHTLHRELVRVPLAVRAPGFEARRVTDVVRTVDVMPTVLDLLGVETPPMLEGESLTRTMRGERVPDRPALSELRLRRDFAQSLRLGRWKLIVDQRLARRKGGEVLDPAGEVRRRLYDVVADADEHDDVAAENADVLGRLTERLEQMIERAAKRAAGGLFGDASTVDLTPDELRQLEELGYTK